MNHYKCSLSDMNIVGKQLTKNWVTLVRVGKDTDVRRGVRAVLRSECGVVGV